MAGGKQTPRQKMINLMYLIFIAMMAMNVDREVLRSFEGVNKALTESTGLAESNNETFYAAIEAKKKDDKDYILISQKAAEVKKKANETYNAIEDLKKSLVGETGYIYRSVEDEEESDYNSLQNTDVVNHVFFTTEKKLTDKADKMVANINGFRDFMIKGFDAKKDKDKKYVDRLNQLFDTSDKKTAKGKRAWATILFYDQPMIAALTNLSRYQSNVRTEEGNRIRDLLSNKLEEDIEVKKFIPIVSAPKYVKRGEKFDVTIAFGAYDNTLVGSVNLNGRTVGLTDGRAVVPTVATGVGTQHLKGNITYKSGNQTFVEKFDQTYEVVEEVLKDLPTGGVVTADKMNVVYRGVDNPMSASVTGVDASTIRLSASGGSLSKVGKGWNYKPGAGKEVKFTVSGITDGGKTISTPFTFRVKNIPKAEGQIRGQNVVSMPVGSIVNQTVSAAIPDFEFPVTFTVNSFMIKVPGIAAKTINGSSLRGAGDLMSRVRAGDQVAIFNISASAKGIDGIRTVSPVVINVQ